MRLGSETMSSLPMRPLGRTGRQVAALALGGVTYSSHDDAHAAAVVHRALDLGINYIDTAHTYEGSERKIGLVMAERRDEVYLATKSIRRDRDGMAEDIQTSLKRLRTDCIDCVQVHDLGDERELAEMTGRNGALRAIEEFRRQGSVRFVGVTGHRNPEILAKALQEYAFDTLLVSLGAMHAAVRPFYEVVMPAAQQRGVAVLGMKVMAHGWLGERSAQAVRFVLSLPGVSAAVVGVDNIKELEQNARAARDAQPMGEAERKELLEAARRMYHDRRHQAWFIHK